MKPQFNPSTNHYFNPAQLHNPSTIPGNTYQQIAAASNSAEINIKTKDGDLVTISQNYSNQLHTQQSITQATSTSLATAYENQGFSFNVQGNLNEQELQDLTELLSDLNNIANHFFSGNMEEAINESLNIGDMGSIAMLEASFSRTSMLSQYMQGPHPIPNFGPNFIDHFYEETSSDKNNQPTFSETMRAQFAQLLDYLNEQTDPPESEANKQQPDNNMQATSDQMLARSLETMRKHPHITPLLPPLADLAIDKAFSNFSQIRENKGIFNQLKNTFSKDFTDWII